MTNTRLSDKKLRVLRPLEERLRCAVRAGLPEAAVEIATEIQILFGPDRTHHRLLRAKLWAFEACLEANRLSYAERGLIGVRKLSGVEDQTLLGGVKFTRCLLSAAEECLPLRRCRKPKNIGKTTFAVLRRVAWKTFCNPDSTIYQLWSKRIPKVFNEGYFAAAVATTFGDLRVGVPLLASGVVALVMKYSAEEFCELARPKGIMIDQRGNED